MIDDQREGDLILWILRRVCDCNPGAARIFEIEQLTRRHWGGKRPYIQKRGCGVMPRARRQPLP
jgi:hypothetical protein